MDLLIVRHAIAEDREEFAKSGKSDEERPTTAEGRRKLERAARGLARLVKSLDLLATSPLVRAVETAEIVAHALEVERVVKRAELEPGAEPAALLPWLGKQRRLGTVAIVGHEPHLSSCVALLLTGDAKGFLDLKKGGACLLRLGDEPQAGSAELRWLLTAGQLRRLGR